MTTAISDLDMETIINLVRRMSNAAMEILKVFPEEGDGLKHLAASQIHLTFFIRDLAEMELGIKINKDKVIEDDFMKKCGCNIIPNCS